MSGAEVAAGQTVFIVIAIDWHFGIDSWPFTSQEAAFTAARELAVRRCERSEEPGSVAEVGQPGVLLCLRYSPEGFDPEDMVWVVSRPVDVPIVDPDCDCHS